MSPCTKHQAVDCLSNNGKFWLLSDLSPEFFITNAESTTCMRIGQKVNLYLEFKQNYEKNNSYDTKAPKARSVQIIRAKEKA